MSTTTKIAGALLLSVILAKLYQAREKEQTFTKALIKAKTSGKPLLNAGCGGDFLHLMAEDIASKSDVNIDIIDRPNIPRFQRASIENMPMFKDKQFGAVFCSHVIEHVEHPDIALRELDRVAESVYVITPAWWDISTYFWPGHKYVRMPSGRFLKLGA